MTIPEKRFSGVERLRQPERVERLEVARVVNLCLEGCAAKTVLDVGTGSGLFAEAFSERGLMVTGVDVNAEMLAAAAGFIPGADFRQAAAEALPFADGAFDLAFLGVVLHETDDTLAALKEAARVARQRACVLEWPYKQQPFGPPMEHRLEPAKLVKWFGKVSFKRWEALELDHTVLYILEK